MRQAWQICTRVRVARLCFQFNYRDQHPARKRLDLPGRTLAALRLRCNRISRPLNAQPEALLPYGYPFPAETEVFCLRRVFHGRLESTCPKSVGSVHTSISAFVSLWGVLFWDAVRLRSCSSSSQLNSQLAVIRREPRRRGSGLNGEKGRAEWVGGEWWGETAVKTTKGRHLSGQRRR